MLYILYISSILTVLLMAVTIILKTNLSHQMRTSVHYFFLVRSCMGAVAETIITDEKIVKPNEMLCPLSSVIVIFTTVGGYTLILVAAHLLDKPSNWRTDDLAIIYRNGAWAFSSVVAACYILLHVFLADRTDVCWTTYVWPQRVVVLALFFTAMGIFIMKLAQERLGRPPKKAFVRRMLVALMFLYSSFAFGYVFAWFGRVINKQTEDFLWEIFIEFMGPFILAVNCLLIKYADNEDGLPVRAPVEDTIISSPAPTGDPDTIRASPTNSEIYLYRLLNDMLFCNASNIREPFQETAV